MAAPKHDPDLPDAWLLWLWLAGSVFWYYTVRDYVPSTHPAYWRETTVTATAVSMLFTGMAGLARPAGWLAILTMICLGCVMPTIEAPSLSTYFWISYYFTLVFSVGSTLTLRKMAKISGISGLLIGFGYLIDPTARLRDLGLGLLAWLGLIGMMMLVNGLLRFIRLRSQAKTSLELELIEA